MVKQNIKTKIIFQLIALSVSFIFFNGCSKDEVEPKSKMAQITGFHLYKTDNPGLSDDITATIEGGIVKFEVSDAVDITSLVPTVLISQGATVSPASGEAMDFSKDLKYIVTAEDGTTKSEYTIQITSPKSQTAQITGFHLYKTDNPGLSDDITATIEGGIVKFEVSDAADITSLVPTVLISEGATVSPASGEAMDFSKELKYTVTAEDGTTKSEYTIQITSLSSKNTLSEFSLSVKGVTFSADIDENSDEIRVSLPYATDLSSLAPVVNVAEGSTVVPASGEAVDFSNNVSYEVTAADGSKKTYTVQLRVMSGTENDRFVLEALYNLNKDYNTGGNYLKWDLGAADMSAWEGITIEDGRVKKVSIDGKAIKKLPKSIGMLSELIDLNLSYVGLEEVPAQIGYLTNLEVLFLFNNAFSSLPPEVGNLESLENCGLDENRLTTIPVEMCSLKSLKYLYLNNNKITELPAQIGNLTALVEFDLWYNQLTSLPVEISNLKNLSWFSITENPLTSIPVEICNMVKPDGSPITIEKDADDVCE